ncbi:YesL family protein [Cohnella sp. AR92]|uniref:YesL family protein n=1 Tax=Cohnella sp. AR92 TaxID=648716 RepID=UPI000F8E6089|nr:DUF624 domain-containing protein [Cohnella sp. AR92]RUS47730.1 DUF624 domain-containing protein [Cohnella sp. AR92]
MEMRGMMGGFYKISEWIMRLAVTNVLWVLCSIPVFLAAFSGLVTADQEGSLVWHTIVISILSPFTLFPATSAMFSVARKWVMGDTDVPLFKTFFRNYKQNYVQAMLGGIIYAVLFAVLFIDYRVYLKDLDGFGVLAILFLALMVLLFVSVFQFFSLLSHFHMKTMQLIKNSVILTIGRPFRSLSTAIVSGFILYISIFTKFTFLIPFFMGSLIAVFAFFNFYQTIQKMQAKAAANEADEDALPIEESPTKDDEKIK